MAAELAARLRGRFILLAPTSSLLDAACQELLAHAGAALFGLDSCLVLSARAVLQASRPPGELFAAFQPTARDAETETVARRAFVMVKALEAETRSRKAPVLTVFRLYCVEGLSVGQVARQCRCTRPVIFARLKLLRQKLGLDPAQLRQFSSQFESIERSLSDPRARRIYRKGAMYGDETAEQD